MNEKQTTAPPPPPVSTCGAIPPGDLYAVERMLFRRVVNLALKCTIAGLLSLLAFLTSCKAIGA